MVGDENEKNTRTKIALKEEKKEEFADAASTSLYIAAFQCLGKCMRIERGGPVRMVVMVTEKNVPK